jgi:hypothetical protein
MYIENYNKKHLFILGLIMLSFGNLFAEQSNEKNVSITLQNTNDSSLVLVLDQSNGKKILKVSFNGNEGNEGSLVILSNSIIVKSAQFELIKTPYSASVDVSNLASGTYEVILTTASGTHSAQITIA